MAQQVVTGSRHLLLSMKKEDREKREELLSRLDSLLHKYKYYVSTHKDEEKGTEEKLIGDLTCWYNQEGKLIYNTELEHFFKNIDDATHYRSCAYENFVSNVNINHIAFDALHKMKYSSDTLEKVYQKIRVLNTEECERELKDMLFEEVFALCVQYEALLEIHITTEQEVEEARVREEKKRGGTEVVKRDFPENRVIKEYCLCVKEESERAFKHKLYQLLMKHKYFVNHISEVCDFSKWCSAKSGNNTYIMKKLKYYFDDMVDVESKRIQLFLVHRNTPFSEITKYYESSGMGYTSDEIRKALEIAKEEEKNFYIKLFELMLEYDMILEVKGT